MKHNLTLAADASAHAEFSPGSDNAAPYGVNLVMLATLAHEIRNPMHGVLGFADLLATTDLTPEQKRYLELLREAGASLMTLVEDVLRYAGVMHGAGNRVLDMVDLRGLLVGLIELVGVARSAGGLRIELEVDADVPQSIFVDIGPLRQVLINLLSNAAAFTRQGGISVVVTRGSSSERIRFEIHDSGVGIAPDDLGKLFTPFSRLRNATVQQVGSGLGLAICKRLVEEMPGGMIGASSVLGLGSMFWFEARFQDAACSTSDLSSGCDPDTDLRRAEPSIAGTPRGRMLMVAGD